MFRKANVSRKQMDKIHEALAPVLSGFNDKLDAEQIQANRRYVLAQLIEMYSGQKDVLDCLPDLIQVGAFNPIFLRIVQCDIFGNITDKSLNNKESSE